MQNDKETKCDCGHCDYRQTQGIEKCEKDCKECLLGRPISTGYLEEVSEPVRSPIKWEKKDHNLYCAARMDGRCYPDCPVAEEPQKEYGSGCDMSDIGCGDANCQSCDKTTKTSTWEEEFEKEFYQDMDINDRVHGWLGRINPDGSRSIARPDDLKSFISKIESAAHERGLATSEPNKWADIIYREHNKGLREGHATALASVREMCCESCKIKLYE